VASHESDLFKDKIEVKLDERQVFYLFFGGAVIATLVFVLGVMVGRRVEARAVATGGTTVTDPLAALDRLEGGDDLAFPTALRGVDVSLGAVDANLAKRPKPAIGGPLVAPDPKKSDTPLVAKPAAKQLPVPKPAAVKPEVAEPDKKPDEVAEPEANVPEAKKSRKRFTLQVGSFQDKDEADTFFRTLQGGSYAPYMVEADVPGKGTYFRVRVGGYTSFDEALDAKSTFEDTQHVIAYVTRLK
jgi:DedD protein